IIRPLPRDIHPPIVHDRLRIRPRRLRGILRPNHFTHASPSFEFSLTALHTQASARANRVPPWERGRPRYHWRIRRMVVKWPRESGSTGTMAGESGPMSDDANTPTGRNHPAGMVGDVLSQASILVVSVFLLSCSTTNLRIRQWYRPRPHGG